MTQVSLAVKEIVLELFFLDREEIMAFGVSEGESSPSPLTLPPFFPQQTCAVCLEDFKGKDELGVLPCQHAFHRK